jgi:hypothetical protein
MTGFTEEQAAAWKHVFDEWILESLEGIFEYEHSFKRKSNGSKSQATQDVSPATHA